MFSLSISAHTHTVYTGTIIEEGVRVTILLDELSEHIGFQCFAQWHLGRGPELSANTSVSLN